MTTNGTVSNASGDSANGTQEFTFSSNLSLEDVRKIQNNFAKRRNWNQFHSPRNVLLAMVGEVGEVAELFQWRFDSECEPGLKNWTPEQRQALGEELSDVLVYLIRLAERCEIDLPEEVVKKMAKNELKYPVEKAYGSAKKYNEL